MQGEGARDLQESLGHATAPPGPSLETKKQITVRAHGFAWHGLYVVHGEKSEPQQASSNTVFTEADAMRECSREDCWQDLVTEHHIERGSIGLDRYGSYVSRYT